jgi:protein-tyrosine phosphatase
MFSIFSKKVFLVDYLQDFVDFHNHILPGIDDGAQNVSQSLDLLREFKNIGIEKIIATPHIIGEYYPNTPESIKASYEKLCKEYNNSENVNFAAEYMLDQNFLEILKSEKILPIVRNYVLVEMSYFQPPLNINEILFNLQNNSFHPILAHPERYTYLHTKSLDKYIDLKSRGCKFQLNMLSLTPHYGLGIHKMAHKLLANNLIDFISSDVHKLAHVQKIKEIKLSKNMASKIETVVNNSKTLISS